MSTQSPNLALETAQSWLLGVVTHPESVAQGVESEASRVAPSELSSVIRATPTASALDRLEIYHSGYFARLEECLADDYSAVKFALGEPAFETLCRDYVQRHPSRHPNLNTFGARFAEFAEERVSEIGQFVVELAKLEWAIVEVVHAPSSDSFTASALENVPPEALGDVRFSPSAAARLLFFEYPVNEYLQAVLQDRHPEIPGPAPCTVLLVRRAYRNRRMVLEPDQARVLGKLLAGECLAHALSSIAANESEVGGWFRSWTELGVFAGLHV